MFSATVIGNTVSDTVVVSTTVIAAVVLNVLVVDAVSGGRNRQRVGAVMVVVTPL